MNATLLFAKAPTISHGLIPGLCIHCQIGKIRASVAAIYCDRCIRASRKGQM